jgi:rhamnosyl/mannosyltransferase
VNLNGITGIEVANKDVVAYAEAIDKLLSDETLARRYAEAAHLRAEENFTIPKMMEKMNEVYYELMV